MTVLDTRWENKNKKQAKKGQTGNHILTTGAHILTTATTSSRVTPWEWEARNPYSELHFELGWATVPARGRPRVGEERPGSD